MLPAHHHSHGIFNSFDGIGDCGLGFNPGLRPSSPFINGRSLTSEDMQAANKVSISVGEVLTSARSISQFPPIVEGRYEARLSKNAAETAMALRLRFEVFSVELGGTTAETDDNSLEFDAYDFKCRHLIVFDRQTGAVVGTYRLNTMETARSVNGFYSASEFTLESLPLEILRNGIEIGRACVAKEHRNTKVLFLLWKALLSYSQFCDKRYFFGCCSIFSRDAEVGSRAYAQLLRSGNVDDSICVKPRRNAVRIADDAGTADIELPPLFNMYLRLGAKVCSVPMIDSDFGTIDLFVVFDTIRLNEKYRRMFSI